MIIVNSLVSKAAAALEAGELFTTDISDEYALCIFLRVLPGGRKLIAVLDAPPLKVKPAVVAADLNAPCLSFGTEWILELSPGPETFPQNTWDHDKESRIFIDGPVVVLRLVTGRDVVTIRLDTMADHQMSARAAPVRNWRIWRSEADRAMPGANPVFSYP